MRAFTFSALVVVSCARTVASSEPLERAWPEAPGEALPEVPEASAGIAPDAFKLDPPFDCGGCPLFSWSVRDAEIEP